MTRVSDASAANSLINTMMRTQSRIEDTNYQVTTGKVARQYAGIAGDSQRLVDLELTHSLNSRFIKNNNIANLRLDVMKVATDSLERTMSEVRKTVNGFLEADDFGAENLRILQEYIFSSLKTMEALLNTEVNGQHLFSGSRTDRVPVDLGLTSLAEFQERFDGAANTYPTTRASHTTRLERVEDTNNLDAEHIDASNWLVFRRDDDGDDATPGISSIEATSPLFSDYRPGSRINVTGTASNNGEYTVESVSADGTKIFVSTEMYTDEEVPLALMTETVAGIAQVDTLTLGGTFEADDVFNISVNGTTLSYTAVDNDANGDGVTDLNDTRDSIITALNAHDELGAIVTASAGADGEIVLTADNPGDEFTTTAFATNGEDAATNDSTIEVATTTPNGGDITVTLGDGSTITNSLTGDVEFNRSTGIITATREEAFDSVSVGDVINVGNGNESDGAYTVTAVAADGQSLTVANRATLTTPDGRVIETEDTARMIFDRAANTITADDPVFGILQPGDKFTVAGTSKNNGIYTVGSVSADGRTITTTPTRLTDEGGSTGTDTAFFDYTVGSRFLFNATVETIQAQDILGSALPGSFSDLQPGDSVTVDGSTSNDATYTVGSVSADGSTVTLADTTPLIGNDGIDSNGVGLSAPARDFEFRAGNEIVFDDTMDTISLRDITSLAGSQDVFSNLRLGQEITISGTTDNDGTYTIASILPDGSGFTVAENITVAETFNPGGANAPVRLQVLAAAGSITSSQSYYNGNDMTTTHRVDENRTIAWDINASDPAFEKVIRAMGIIAQGVLGSEGGLDQNRERITDAIYLLNDAKDGRVEGTPPYGPEESGNITAIQQNIGFKQVVLNAADVDQGKINTLLEGFASDIENADKLEAITRLVQEQRILQSSYQVISRYFQMNLTDFI